MKNIPTFVYETSITTPSGAPNINFASAMQGANVRLTWTNPSGIQSITFARKTGSGAFVDIGTVSGSGLAAAQFIDDGTTAAGALAANTTYIYRATVEIS